MKIVIDKKELIDALVIGGSFSCRNKLLPILDCVKFKVKQDGIRIISSDNENAISKKCGIIESDFESEFCISYKNLLSYVKLVSDSVVELVINDNMTSVDIRHNKGSLSIPIQEAREFPATQQVDNVSEVRIDSNLLHNWLMDAKDFTGNDELRPQMNGIYLYHKDGELGCVSTDSHALYFNHTNDDQNIDFEFILNKNILTSVFSVCKSVESVLFKIGEKNVTIIGDGVTIIARNIEGRYPNFKAIIPTNNDFTFVVNKKELKESVLRCLVGADQASMLLKMDFNGNKLSIVAENFDYNAKSVEELEVVGKESILIGFKATFLTKVIETIATDDILVKLKSPSNVGVFHECRDGKQYSNKLALLMPMMLR